jgi:hypothetical protein
MVEKPISHYCPFKERRESILLLHKVRILFIKGTTVYAPSSELGLPKPLSRQRECPSPQHSAYSVFYSLAREPFHLISAQTIVIYHLQIKAISRFKDRPTIHIPVDAGRYC